MTRDPREWSVVETVTTQEEAQLIVGFLENRGIDCRIDSTHSNEFPLNVGELAAVKIEVPADRFGEARDLMQEAEIGEGE